MNHAVVAASESDDVQMQVRLVGKLPAATDTFPTTIALQVATDNSNTNPDYQFVLEVRENNRAELEDNNSKQANFFFVHGACDQKRRVAGRGREIVELTWQSSNVTTAQVWAAWAAGHEAVRLTPVLELALDQNNSTTGGHGAVEGKKLVRADKITEDAKNVKKPTTTTNKEQDVSSLSWDEALLSEPGCTSMDISTATSIQNIQVVSTTQIQLHIAQAPPPEDNDRVPAELTIGIKKQKEAEESSMPLVLQASPGATFNDTGAACHGQRTAISSGLDTKPLTVHHEETTTIKVWGLYRVGELLYRTAPLELEWIPPPAKRDEHHSPPDEILRQEDEEDAVDPQTVVDRQAQKGLVLDLEEQIEEHRKKLNGIGDNGDEKQRPHRLHDSNRKNARPHRTKVRPKNKETKNDVTKEERQRRKPRREFDEHGHPYVRHDLHNNDTTENDDNDDTLSFSMSGYYFGLAILIGANAATVQVCLVLSRHGKKKGLRDQ